MLKNDVFSLARAHQQGLERSSSYLTTVTEPTALLMHLQAQEQAQEESTAGKDEVIRL